MQRPWSLRSLGGLGGLGLASARPGATSARRQRGPGAALSRICSGSRTLCSGPGVRGLSRVSIVSSRTLCSGPGGRDLSGVLSVGSRTLCSGSGGRDLSRGPVVSSRTLCSGPGGRDLSRVSVVSRRTLCSGPGGRDLSGVSVVGRRTLCSGPGGRDQSGVSVVGSADPLTWLHCRFIILLVHLLFEVDLASDEFYSGAKQALVQVSKLMSKGRFHRLKGMVSDEMMEYVETRTRALSPAQMEQLLVTAEDIIFMLPEDVSVVFDQYGRKFCTIVIRFWFMTALEGPEDPEATRIFRVAPRQDGRPQEKVATAVYEFKRELTKGASPDWTVITVWHWHWTLAPKAPEAPD